MTCRQRPRVVDRRGAQVAVDDRVDEPERDRRRGVDGLGAEHELERLLDADQPRHALRPARARNDAERDLGHSEARSRRRNAVVTGQCDLDAAAEHGAVHRCDDRDRRAPRCGRKAHGRLLPAAAPRTPRCRHPRRRSCPRTSARRRAVAAPRRARRAVACRASRTAMLSVLTGGLSTVSTAMPSI